MQASARDLAEFGLAPESIDAIKRPDRDALGRILAWSQHTDSHILPISDPRYPPMLAQIADPPTLLYVRGAPELLLDPQLAIVGSRSPTIGGVEITLEFSRWIAARGITVTSGLARGIDAAAHRGALETGRTIAVLGTGPDRVYPAAHRKLAQTIAERGALVSEYPPGQGPLAHHFPRRNRIISGLSLGVLVTEAALRSGSLITARWSLEQGREVFSVPGSIRNPLARGCHALIRDGASLAEHPSEILAELAPQLNQALQDLGPRRRRDGQCEREQGREIPLRGMAEDGLDADYRALLEAMGFDPVAPDELIARSGLAAREVASMLLVLELEGHVSSSPGGRYCRMRA